jgi:hypothetical protein
MHNLMSQRWRIMRDLFALVLALLLSAAAAYAGTSYTFQTLNDPDGNLQTIAMGIDDGNIVGSFETYINGGNSDTDGFIYNIATQTYTTLDDPAANALNGGTAPSGISGGNIVGHYFDNNYVPHGFIYNIATQTYTTLDDPDASTGSYTGTYAYGISDGNIVGYYSDNNDQGYTQGFLYNIATQTYTTFSDPDGNQTWAVGISGGNIVGYYYDFNLIQHGFLLNLATGNYTNIDDPAANFANGGTVPSGISGGNIVGYYQDKNNHTHGFVYNITSNLYTTLDDPASPAGEGTYAYGISGGNIVGYAFLSGFLATPPQPPAIIAQPANVTVTAPAAANLTVAATGTTPLKYQWYLNGKKISGATKFTYSIPKTALTNAGNYMVVVSNSLGNTTSTIAILTVNTPPKITTPPKALTLAYGATGNLTVVATGTATLVYQWHQNNGAITGNATGANSPVLHFPFATPADAGNYTVSISNNYGGPITGGIAKVTVKVTAPKITKQPIAPKPAPTVGSDVNLTVTATGSDTPLLYQWTFQTGKAPAANVTFSNATGTQSAELSLTSVSADEAGNYSVTVSNLAGSVKSKPVKLTVQ